MSNPRKVKCVQYFAAGSPQHSYCWLWFPLGFMNKVLFVPVPLLCSEIGSFLRRKKGLVFLSRHHICCTGCTCLQSGSSPVTCCWPSPAQSILVSGSFGTHDHIFVHSTLLRVLNWGLLFGEGRGMTSTAHSASTRE
jgi:hypothetical protein